MPHRVLAYENAERKHVIYLRWRANGEWARRSLGYGVRTEKGKLDKTLVQQATDAANAQYLALIGAGSIPEPVAAPLTIAEGWALAIDANRGKWNTETPHRKELERAIKRAKTIWGANRAWNTIERGDLRTLWRKELDRVRGLGNKGARSAEIIVTRVLSLAAWLRDEQKIAPTACVPWKSMKEEMAKDIGAYEPQRLRYTLDEFRALLAVAPSIDPRWGLLLALGAEYRLGQVVRCMRSALHLADRTLTIAGSGKKRGTVVHLTDAQHGAAVEALAGHLGALELAYVPGAIANYPLFPGGRLPRVDGVVSTRADHATRAPLGADHQLRAWLADSEAKARVNGEPIPHVKGRGWYGLRRAAVDAAKEAGISREGLQQHGGWSDTQMPDMIYADQKASYAGKEASTIRAQIRGETDAKRTQMQNDAEASFNTNPLTVDNT